MDKIKVLVVALGLATATMPVMAKGNPSTAAEKRYLPVDRLVYNPGACDTDRHFMAYVAKFNESLAKTFASNNVQLVEMRAVEVNRSLNRKFALITGVNGDVMHLMVHDCSGGIEQLTTRIL